MGDLTPRQTQMLASAAEGHNRQQVAAIHGVTLETVKSHYREISLRLDARNHAHAVAIAIRRGLI